MALWGRNQRNYSELKEGIMQTENVVKESPSNSCKSRGGTAAPSSYDNMNIHPPLRKPPVRPTRPHASHSDTESTCTCCTAESVSDPSDCGSAGTRSPAGSCGEGGGRGPSCKRLERSLRPASGGPPITSVSPLGVLAGEAGARRRAASRASRSGRGRAASKNLHTLSTGWQMEIEAPTQALFK